MSFDKSASRRQFLYDFKFTSIKQAYWSDVSLGGRWESLKLMRNKLCDKLGSSLSEQVAVENLLNGTLLYLPELFLLISDLTGCQSELLTTAEFSLQSILMTSDDFQAVGFTEELAFFMFVAGMCHYKLAAMCEFGSKDQLENNKASAKNAVQHLKTGAGIFDRLQNILEKSDVKTNSRVCEAYPVCAEAMSKLSLSHAQEIMVMMATQQGKSNRLIAKLCLGLSSSYTEISSLFGTMGAAFHFVKKDFREFLAQKNDLYKSMADCFLARAEIHDVDGLPKYGDAICRYRTSYAALSSMEFPREESTTLRCVKAAKEHFENLVDRELKALEKDNDSVYHLRVKRELEVDPTPPGIFAVKAELFQIENSGAQN
eukprot:116112_1